MASADARNRMERQKVTPKSTGPAINTFSFRDSGRRPLREIETTIRYMGTLGKELDSIVAASQMGG